MTTLVVIAVASQLVACALVCLLVGVVIGVLLGSRKPEVAEHVVDELVKASTSEEVRAVLHKLLGITLVVALVASCSSTSPQPDASLDARALDAHVVDAHVDGTVDVQLAPCAADASVVPCACANGGVCVTASQALACASGAGC